MAVDKWSDLLVEPDDRILTAWNRLAKKGDDTQIVIGGNTRVRSLPKGGVMVSGAPDRIVLRHPWRCGFMDDENMVVVREGTIDGKFPWVDEDHKLGELDENGALPRVKLEPKEEGFSFVAIGVNVRNSESNRAEIDEEATWEQLRIAEIAELPKGFGSGGTLEDTEGWAWYPVVRIKWEERRMSAQFQIVRHNLGHFVVKGEGEQARHFFPPV